MSLYIFSTSDGLVTWGNVSAYCLDTAQSPFNLDSFTAQLETSSDALTFDLYDLVTKDTTVLENNGHSIKLEVNFNSISNLPKSWQTHTNCYSYIFTGVLMTPKDLSTLLMANNFPWRCI